MGLISTAQIGADMNKLHTMNYLKDSIGNWFWMTDVRENSGASHSLPMICKQKMRSLYNKLIYYKWFTEAEIHPYGQNSVKPNPHMSWELGTGLPQDFHEVYVLCWSIA